MIKKILLAVALGTVLFGCNDDKKQENELLKQIIEKHNKVMNEDETVVNNTTRLKSISANSQDMIVKDSVLLYIKSLNTADSVMMKWMGKFNPDFTGKTHQQIMSYLTRQQTEILKVDSQMSIAVNASDRYIVKVKGK